MALDVHKHVLLRPIEVGQTLLLRQHVLWPDLPIDKLKLPEDGNGWHFGAFVPDDPSATDDPIAVISLFLDPIPIDCGAVISEDSEFTNNSESLSSFVPSRAAVRFRKFACRQSMQGQGIGTALLKYALDFARSNLNAQVFWCDARVSSASWYERRGLVRFGEKFYKGPVEYVRMRRALFQSSDS
ncbi:hypothetical protein GYMLUDRAFT_236442 [Collybiopsis luxurians FD-317 M1]|nr:hypothetical protein GYMLUDRAFT_236442 [Collybiopsis luxurians FD-317 M1]